MSPQTFIFMGRSGCGKGTQVSLLMEYLKKNDPKRRILHLETGKEFRKILEGQNWTSRIVKEIYDKGGLMPEFLPVWIWSDFLFKNLEEDDHIIMDGVSRRVKEAEILHSAFDFYKRDKLFIVLINVSRKWAFDRLIARKRVDDTEEDINERLNWFDTEVSRALDFYKNHSGYNVLDVNGEQTIPEVHAELISKMNIHLK